MNPPGWRLATALIVAGSLLLSPLAMIERAADAQVSISGRILFAEKGNLRVWSSGEVKTILEDGAASDPTWAPDGKQVLFVRVANSYSDMIVLNVADGTQTALSYNQPPYEEGTPEYIQASTWVSDPSWSASGTIGYLSDFGELYAPFGLWLMDGPTGAGYRAASAQSEDNLDSLDISTNGTLAAYVEQQRRPDGVSSTRAILRDLSDGVAYPLADVNAFDPAISPDEQSVAIAVRADDNTTDIYIVSRATGELTRVTSGASATNPIWSPDGATIAFVRMVNFDFQIWIVPVVDGTPGTPERLFDVPDLDATGGLSWTATVV